MKNFIFTICIAILSTVVQAQIIYDFAQGSFIDQRGRRTETVSAIRYGATIVLEIRNVNTFRYKVEIKNSNIDYVTQVPSALQALFRLPQQEAAAKNNEGLVQSRSATESMNALANATPAGAVKTELIDLVRTCSTYLADATRINNHILEIKSRKKQLIDIATSRWPRHSDLLARLGSLTLLNTAQMRTDFTLFQNNYANAYAQYSAVLSTPGLSADDRKIIEEAEDDLEQAFTKINDEDLLLLIEQVTNLEQELSEPSNFTVRSGPIQAEGDFMRFEVTITPSATSELKAFESAQTFEFEAPVYRGLRADFSVGPAFSFGKGARDDKFFLQPSSTDTTQSVLMKGGHHSSARPSIAAFMHVYIRTGRNFGMGPLLGVGANFNTESDPLTASYYLGWSLVGGKREKVMLNFGASLLPVDRLAPGFKVSNSYSKDTKISDVTEKVLRSSFFFSLSYNLTSRKEVD
jgi:hypothetical protein